AQSGVVLERALEHHRGGNQGPGSGDRRRVGGNDGEHPLAPQTRVGLTDRVPGGSEGVDDSRCGHTAMIANRELKRSTDIGVLFANADGRVVLREEELQERLAGEAPNPVEVTLGQRVPFPGLTESLGCVLTDGFEEPKTSTRTSWNSGQERTFDELFEEIDDPSRRDLVIGDDVLSRVGRKAPGEDGQASEHGPFVAV